MKLKTSVILALLVFTHTSLLLGQSTADQRKARAYYIQAEAAYESEEWAKTLEYLDQAVELLGGQSNATIAGLRVKALYEQGSYAEAQQALNRFFKMEASASLIKEMSSYLVSIEEALEKERLADLARKEKARKEKLAKRKAAERAKALLEAKNKYGTLVQVINQGDLEAARRLIALGFDVNEPDSATFGHNTKSVVTPLYVAVVRSHTLMVQTLLEAGADVNFYYSTDGHTPIQAICYAKTEERRAILKLLLEYDANIDAQTYLTEFAPLHFAAVTDNYNCAALLLEFGANVNVKDIYGRTPLVLTSNSKLVNLLKQHGGIE